MAFRQSIQKENQARDAAFHRPLDGKRINRKDGKGQGTGITLGAKMTREEFNSWLAQHQRAYPALSDWLHDLPDVKGTLTLWFKTIAHLDKNVVDQITLRMMAGTEPIVKYTNWHDTPRFVCEHASDIKKKSAPPKRFELPFVERRDKYACNDCRDTGTMTVFFSRDVIDARNNRLSRQCIRRSVVACRCAASAKYSSMIEVGMMRPFDENADVPVPSDRVSCTVASLDADCELICGSVSGPVSIDEWVAP